MVIMISGNDGAGKSTYIRVNLVGSSVRHFYNNKARRLIRYIVVRNNTSEKVRFKRMEKTSFPRLAVISLLIYHFVKAMDIRLSSLRAKQLVFDRGFIDELVSLSVLKGIRYNVKCLKFFYMLAGVNRIIFLDADSRKKFDRIVDKDIGWDLYLEKESEYERLTSGMSKLGVTIEYVCDDK